MRPSTRRWSAAIGVAAVVVIGAVALVLVPDQPQNSDLGAAPASAETRRVASTMPPTRDVVVDVADRVAPGAAPSATDMRADTTVRLTEPVAAVVPVEPTPFVPSVQAAEPLPEPSIVVPADDPVAHGAAAARALVDASPAAREAVATNAVLPVDDVVDELAIDPLLFVGRDGMVGSIEPMVDEHSGSRHDHGDHDHHESEDHQPGDEPVDSRPVAEHGALEASAAIIDPAAAAAPADALALHSRPSARRTVYLDLDGHRVEGEWWNWAYEIDAFESGPYDIDGDPSTFSTTERNRIIEIWERVADDYAPFDVNVTTQDPGVEALRRTSPTDDSYGTRVVITSTDWYWDAQATRIGGIALVNVFSSSRDHSAFVFAGNLSGGAAKEVSDAASHESGHNFGLRHDGSPAGSYYRGHGQWGSIMGAPYSRAITHWSAGEYPGADNQEDDLDMIAAHTGYIDDDHDGAAPTPIGQGVTSGVLTNPDDVDAFALELGGADASISVRPRRPWSNVHTSVVVRDESGAIVAKSRPSSAVDWRVDIDVPPGRARLTIEVGPEGWSTPADGFVRYGALGAFDLFVEVGEPSATTTTTTTAIPDTTPSTTTPTTTPAGRPPAQPNADDNEFGGFVAMEPLRLADSRRSLRVVALAPGATQRVEVAGRAGIPDEVLAVAANVTVVGADRNGFVAVYRCAPGVPEVSSLNVRPGRPVANHAIVALDDTGQLCVYSTVRGDVVIDITSYFSSTGVDGLHPVRPVRLVDTRDTDPIVPDVSTPVDVTSTGVVPPGAVAAVFNIASVRPGTEGWVRIVPCGETPNEASTNEVSTLNTVRGRVVTNSAIVPLSSAGTVCIESNRVGDVIVDLTGYLAPDGLRLQPIDSSRVFDTRDGRRSIFSALSTAGGAPLQIGGFGNAPDGVAAVSFNLTAVRPANDGYLTAWPCSPSSNPGRPDTSNVNYPGGINAVANGVTVGAVDGHVCLYNHRRADVIVDVTAVWRKERVLSRRLRAL